MRSARQNERVAELQSRGYSDARLYDARESSVGGIHALSIILGHPENYNLPPMPEVPHGLPAERLELCVDFRGDSRGRGLRRLRAALMTPDSNRRASEERLREIREAAAQSAPPDIADHPRIQGHGSYYGLPALKPPTWTWEVPLYFFIGGIAGVSSCIAFIAHIFGADPALIRLSLWIGLGGAAICPILLISDLGRPSRFLNMLRVFKLRSPMSLGAWILVAFSGCVFLAVMANELIMLGYGSPLVRGLGWLLPARDLARSQALCSPTTPEC